MRDTFGSALWGKKDGGRTRALVAAAIAVVALAAPSVARAGAIDEASWSSPARANAAWSTVFWSSAPWSSVSWTSNETGTGLAFLDSAAYAGCEK